MDLSFDSAECIHKRLGRTVNVEIAVGHLPGAINIPLRELEQRLGGLSRRREIVAYCRGPYCVLSFDAVAALRGRGFKVRRLVDGYPEWIAAGLPVETALTA